MSMKNLEVELPALFTFRGYGIQVPSKLKEPVVAGSNPVGRLGARSSMVEHRH